MTRPTLGELVAIRSALLANAGTTKRGATVHPTALPGAGLRADANILD